MFTPQKLALVSSLLLTIVFFLGNSGEASGLSIDHVTIRQPELLDITGQDTSQLQVGQQGVVQIVITNNLETIQPFVMLTEVRDGSGITTYLAWQSGQLAASGIYTFETSWMPTFGCYDDIDWLCTYEIRAFVVTDLVNPQVLSAVATLGGITVTETLELDNKMYELIIDGTNYEISYSLDSGSITDIVYSPDVATITVFLKVARDTLFTVEMPAEIIKDRILCGNLRPPGASYADMEVFVDTLPVDVEQIDNSDSMAWRFHVKAGTEEVEFVGNCWIH